MSVIFNYQFIMLKATDSLGVHDCRLFTLKAIEYFDGERILEFIGFNELNLWRQICFSMAD